MSPRDYLKALIAEVAEDRMMTDRQTDRQTEYRNPRACAEG